MNRICEICGGAFTPHASAPHQKYCGKRCYQKSRNHRQKERLKNDPDYQANQSSSQRKWRTRNPQYMRDYRKKNPGYVKRNRIQQRRRNRARQKSSQPLSSLVSSEAIVKMTSLHVDGKALWVQGWAVSETGEIIVKMTGLQTHAIGLSASFPVPLKRGRDCKEIPVWPSWPLPVIFIP